MPSIAGFSSKLIVLCLILCMICNSQAEYFTMATHSSNPIRTSSKLYIYASEHAVIPYEVRCEQFYYINTTFETISIYATFANDVKVPIQLFSPTALEMTVYDTATDKAVSTTVTDSIFINRDNSYTFDIPPQPSGDLHNYYVIFRSLFKFANSTIGEPKIKFVIETISSTSHYPSTESFYPIYVSTPAESLSLVPAAPVIVEDNNRKYFSYPLTLNITTSSTEAPFITLSVSDIVRAAQNEDVQFIFSQENPFCFVDGKNLPVSFNRAHPNKIDIHYPLFGVSGQVVLIDCSSSVMIAAQASGFELVQPDLAVSLTTRYGLQTELITSQRLDIIPVV